MKFKDKLELPIKMEKEKRKEILEVIAKINEEINRINKRLEDDKKEKKRNLEGLIEGKSNTSLFFGYQMDIYEENKLKEQIIILEKEKKEMIMEQDRIKKKIEKMEEERLRRKREYEKQKIKKEEKEVEELKMIIKDVRGIEDEDSRFN